MPSTSSLRQRIAVEADGRFVELQRLLVEIIVFARLGDGIGDGVRAFAFQVRDAELAVGDPAGGIMVDGM
jgi:hypothetical protein